MPNQDDPQFPADGILWRGWSDETLRNIAERAQPVLLFVADPDSLIWPFLRETFRAMPANASLRKLLQESFIALFIKADELPQHLKDLGAGSRYHIAVLSPYGLTPLVTIDPVHGPPGEVVDEIVRVLERVAAAWQ